MSNSRIRLYFHFGDHGEVPEDKLLELISRVKPDVMCIEGAFAPTRLARQSEDLLNTGMHKGRKYLQMLGKTARLANSNVKFYYPEQMDSETSDRLEYQKNSAELHSKKAFRLFLEGRAIDALKEYEKFAKKWGQVHSEREIGFLNPTIRQLHSRIVARYPELGRKRRITVVFKYGSAHSNIYAVAKKSGFAQVSRILEPLYHHSEAIFTRKASIGKPIFENEKEVTQRFAAVIFHTYARNLGTNFSNSAAFGNLRARSMTVERLEDISKSMQERLLLGDHEHEAIGRAMEQNGITMPKNKAEVHTFLRRRRVPIL